MTFAMGTSSPWLHDHNLPQATTDSYRTNVSLDHTQMLHVWNIYLHLPKDFKLNVGKYSSPMEHLGYGPFFFVRYFQL